MSRFTVAPDQLTVLDTTTGLTWTRDDAIDEDVTPHVGAQAAIDKLNASTFGGFGDWRMPTRAELLSLVDDTRHDPAIDIAAFPSCASDWYWTSTPRDAAPSVCVWIVGFSSGDAGYGSRGSRYRVRAVREVAP